MKRILQLKCCSKTFEEIASGKLKVEDKEIKPFWESRLENKEYDEIIFKNGYAKDAPFIRLKCDGISKKNKYHIKLGKILEIKK